MNSYIDFHVHCGIQHNTVYQVEAVSRYILSSKVKKAVISSLSSVASSDYGDRDLHDLSAFSEFVLTYWVNPYLTEWKQKLDILKRSIKISGIKLHPTANIYEPTRDLLWPVFQYCKENKLFITFHTDTFRSLPMKLTELLLDFPDVDVVLIHMDDPINSIYLAKQFANVYLETSWVERKWKHLAPVKLALDSVDNSKIFFGSDFPYGFDISNSLSENNLIRSYEDIVGFYCELLPLDTAEKIVYFNAAHFLAKYGINCAD